MLKTFCKIGLLIVLSNTLLGCHKIAAPVTITPTEASTAVQTQATAITVTRAYTPTSTPTPRPTETRAPTGTATPTRVRIPTWTPVPKLSPEEAERLVKELLHSNAGCVFPCFWGIVPGETEIKPTIRFLAGFTTDIYYDGAYAGMDFRIDDQRSGFIGLFSNQGVITKIIVSQNENPIDAAPLDLPLSRLLKEYGKPDEVYLQGWPHNDDRIPYFGLFVIYAQKGILARYRGEALLTSGQMQVCFQEVGLELIFWDVEAYTDFVVNEIAYQNYLYIAPEYQPLEEVTELSVDTFYEMMQDPQACFLTPKRLWED